MIVFDHNPSGHSRSTALDTINPAVRTLLKSRYPGAGVVGIIAATGWELIQAWDACLNEGRTPIILHFPTPKLSRIYWQDEINFCIKSAGISLLICESAQCVPIEASTPVILLDALPAAPTDQDLGSLPESGNIIQMSSGTTGHRKSINFNIQDVKIHIEDYNATLNLTHEDCIVSWLPLYHDMGFVAAFLMPRLLGCKIVMIDPIDWIRQPEKLWQAIDLHGGTICYMPNFGFEVMASRPHSAPSMRKWISCSEPTRRQTMERFAAATGAAKSTLLNCWGMAENIFAVCISGEMHSKIFGGIEIVSCGRPIAGVDVKSMDGEILVRSSYSVRNYIGASAEIDEEGFYYSGDLGEIDNGNVYLTGRKHDVINIAGRKVFASELDYISSMEVPESAGRIATIAIPEPAIGTDIPVILIEHTHFWRKERDSDLVRRIIARTGIEGTRVHFVPTRFITKTSSGKINRKATRADWLKRREAQDAITRLRGSSAAQARAVISDRFPWLRFEHPLREQIDSLGYVNLRLLLEFFGLANHLKPEMSLDNVFDRNQSFGEKDNNIIKIVSITDANVFQRFGIKAIEDFTEDSGVPVHFKHLCVPALPVLLSDLIFFDFFMARDERGIEPYRAFAGVINDLKAASILIVDEASVAFWPRSDARMVYPQLSHDFRGDEAANLIAVRWARYTENHNLLSSNMIDLQAPDSFDLNIAISDIADYLSIPVVRIAYGRSDLDATSSWEIRGDAEDVRLSAALGNSEGLDYDSLKICLVSALEQASEVAPPRWSREPSFANWSDQPHWCSWTVNPALIDFILDNFNAPAVLGKPGSVPYLSRAAASRGISLKFHLSLQIPDECDCVIVTGSWGRPETEKPIFSVMAGGWERSVAINLPGHLEALCPPARVSG